MPNEKGTKEWRMSGKVNLKITIIIPCYNEAGFLKQSLDSFVSQSRRPEELIIVDDNSSDNTFNIATQFVRNHDWIKVVKNVSSDAHIPGKKVIDAFYFGLSHSKKNYALLGKFDADIVLPKNYFEKLSQHFELNPKLGMCSGLLYIERNNKWAYEPVANKTHIRGPIKLYLAKCFEEIGGLKPSIGWDTLDELLAQFYGYEVLTDHSLKVRHLRPTGNAYNKNAKLLQGEALYKMRYGFSLAILASFKAAWNSKKVRTLFDNISSYFRARKNRIPYLISEDEGKFIRRLRWQNIRKKLF